MENKNDKCIMVIAYYKEKNNKPLFSTEKKLYKNLLNTYGNVEELKDVKEVEMYLLENNYLIRKENGACIVSRIGEFSFQNKRFSSEHKERILKGITFLILIVLNSCLSILAFIISLLK
jgi:hypothetical protein